MMVVLRLRNLDPVSIPHSACDELRFQTWPTPFEVYTCQTHDFLPSFEQPSYILVDSSILSPISPEKEFGPPFQSPLQPGIRHGTWSSSIRCIPMNLLFRSEQGEETSFFFFLKPGILLVQNPAKVCGIWRWQPFPSGDSSDSSFLQCRVGWEWQSQSW